MKQKSARHTVRHSASPQFACTPHTWHAMPNTAQRTSTVDKATGRCKRRQDTVCALPSSLDGEVNVVRLRKGRERKLQQGISPTHDQARGGRRGGKSRHGAGSTWDTYAPRPSIDSMSFPM